MNVIIHGRFLFHINVGTHKMGVCHTCKNEVLDSELISSFAEKSLVSHSFRCPPKYVNRCTDCERKLTKKIENIIKKHC